MSSVSTTSAKIYEMHASSMDNIALKKLISNLKNWLNAHSSRGVAVTDIFNDLGVAYVIATIIERATSDQIMDGDSFQRATPKNYQLLMGIIVQYCEKKLGILQFEDRWTLQGIIDRDIHSLLCFLVDLALIFDCKFEIPPDVQVAVSCKETIDGVSKIKTTIHKITDKQQNDHDVLDTFDQLISSEKDFDEVSSVYPKFYS